MNIITYEQFSSNLLNVEKETEIELTKKESFISHQTRTAYEDTIQLAPTSIKYKLRQQLWDLSKCVHVTTLLTSLLVQIGNYCNATSVLMTDKGALQFEDCNSKKLHFMKTKDVYQLFYPLFVKVVNHVYSLPHDELVSRHKFDTVYDDIGFIANMLYRATGKLTIDIAKGMLLGVPSRVKDTIYSSIHELSTTKTIQIDLVHRKSKDGATSNIIINGKQLPYEIMLRNMTQMMTTSISNDTTEDIIFSDEIGEVLKRSKPQKTKSDPKVKREKFVIKEDKSDLFTTKINHLVQCISEDKQMSKGIALDFNDKYNVKERLTQKVKLHNVYTLNADQKYNKSVINMITKKQYNNKPTLEDMKLALLSLKTYVLKENISSLAMPRIGCGLDQLVWSDVKQLLKDVFNDTTLKISIFDNSKKIKLVEETKETTTVMTKIGDVELPSQVEVESSGSEDVLFH